MILKQVVHPTKPKLAECTGDINIIIKQEVWVVSGTLWKIEFSRHSSRRTLVGRRTRLKLAECTKVIKVIGKQEVWVASCTFWGVRFSHHSWRRKLVLAETCRMYKGYKCHRKNKRYELSPVFYEKLTPHFTHNGRYWLWLVQNLKLDNVEETSTSS